MNLDKDEQLIYDAFSKVEAIETGLAAKVKSRMKAHEATASRRKWKLAAASFVMMLLTIGTVYAATGLGVFDRFIESRNPNFAEIVQPVLVYAEDEGIRIKVIAARQFERDAIIYLSMQDISGQNRLTPSSWKWFSDGTVPGGISGIMLGFDADTNTIYHEMIIRQSHPGVIVLDFDVIVLSGYAFIIEPFPIQPSEMTEAETIYLPYRNYVLKPQRAGNFPPLPNGLYDSPQWISNVGIIENHLHVQFAHMEDFGTAAVRLISPNGEYVGQGVINKSFTLDGDFPHYSFTETIFPIDITNVENYTLILRAYYRDSLSGSWVLEVNTSDAVGEIYTWEGVAHTGDLTINEIVLSPLAVRFSGTFKNREKSDPLPIITIETADAEILLFSTSASFNSITTTFEAVLHTNSPLNVEAITSVIIDGVRIPIN